MSHAVQAAVSILAGEEHRVWRVGATARAALAGEPEPLLAELYTSAPQAVCQAVRQQVVQLEGATHLQIESLGDQSIEAALLARGISVEALAVGHDGEVVDPAGGLAHLETGSLRTIVPPDRALRENPRLLLRVGRVIAWTGFEPSPELRRFAARDSGNLLDIENRNHVWGVEFNALLLGQHIERALQFLEDTRVMAFLMPEVAAMVGFDKTCAVHHKDIWDHTKLVTEKAAPQLVVRWAALCHDIGKVWTRAVHKSGKVHFFRHEGHGAMLFESIAHRFGLDPELTGRTSYLIENHSRVNLYQQDWTDSAVRRLIRQTGDHLIDLVTFSKADYTTKRQSRIREMQRTLAGLEDRVNAIREADARLPPLPAGIGEALMDRFDLTPSRAVGDLKRLLEGACQAGTLPERADTELYLSWLADTEDAQAILAKAPKRSLDSDHVKQSEGGQ